MTPERRTAPEDVLTLVAAGIATAVAGSGMWQFFARIMPEVPAGWRVALFAFVEVAVVTSALRARRNMRERHRAGVDGMAVWALTCLSAVLSTLEARSFAEHVFRLAAPLVAAWLWERGMAIERIRLTGRGRIHWRITPERILVRLGLAEPSERTAGEVDAMRRLTKVALAADRVADARPDSRTARRRLRALKRHGRAMLTHTAVATDPAQQAYVMGQLGVMRSIGGLPAAAPPPFWAPVADTSLTSEVSADASDKCLVTDRPGVSETEIEEILTALITDTSADTSSKDPDDGDRPDDQDNREAERWIRAKMREGKTPTQSEISSRYGFSNGWASLRVRAARADLSAKGYTFLPGNVVKPPATEPIAGPINGATVVLTGGAE